MFFFSIFIFNYFRHCNTYRAPKSHPKKKVKVNKRPLSLNLRLPQIKTTKQKTKTKKMNKTLNKKMKIYSKGYLMRRQLKFVTISWKKNSNSKKTNDKMKKKTQTRTSKEIRKSKRGRLMRKMREKICLMKRICSSK